MKLHKRLYKIEVGENLGSDKENWSNKFWKIIEGYVNIFLYYLYTYFYFISNRTNNKIINCVIYGADKVSETWDCKIR